ncbi:MAG TPA: FliI/YscN family ATPase [Acidobacteriota bacterium]|nr:FliI/YscN family ATPase [Acidobacteriota bacterium]
MGIDLNRYRRKLESIEPLKITGRVRRAGGLVIESDGPPASVGEICEVHPKAGSRPILAEVIGFRDKALLSMPVYDVDGIKLGDPIISRKQHPKVEVGQGLLGRVVDGNGHPIDDKGPIYADQRYPLHRPAPGPLKRSAIDQPLGTGVRAIDGLLPVGRGQRVGIFGGSGVGKSTLLGMMARYTEAAVTVIALVGERGREVNGFIERDLGEEGLKRSVVVVSTSDNPPLMRIRAALTATAIAEYFRDQGKDVLLVMDSVTRVAMAQREIGLAAGEPPSSKGYTPSVFTLLPRVFERAGKLKKGSITGFYTVLVEGDDMNEPIADAVRGLLDGHIVLSRELAWRNHFPSIAVLDSVSRLVSDIASEGQIEAAGRLRELLATYTKSEDMINIGAYSKGSNAKIDQAIARIDHINYYLRQKFDAEVPRETAVKELLQLMGKSRKD